MEADDVVGAAHDETTTQAIDKCLSMVSKEEIAGLKDVFMVIKHTQWATLAALKRADMWKDTGRVSAHDIAVAMELLGDERVDDSEGLVCVRQCVGLPPEISMRTRISERQFIAMASSKATVPLQRLISRTSVWREAFRMFDTDGSGDISADELGELTTQVFHWRYTRYQMQKLADAVDRTGETVIDFAGFVHIVCAKGSKIAGVPVDRLRKDIVSVQNTFHIIAGPPPASFIGASFGRTNLQNFLTGLGSKVTDEQLDKSMRAFDSAYDGLDENGEADFGDFCFVYTGMASESKTLLKTVVSDLEELYELMKAHDDDGEVSAEEMCGIVGRLGRALDEQEKADLMDHIDDGDGTVEFKEFATVFCGCEVGAQRVMRSSIRVLREAFNRFDRDGGGQLEPLELTGMFRLFGLSPTLEEVEGVVALADDGGDGEISFLEFLCLMGAEHQSARYVVLDQLRVQIRSFRDVFDVFDPDQSGEIYPSEITDAMRLFGLKVDTDEAFRLVAEVDMDGDGSLGFTEFVLMVVRAESSCEHSAITLKVTELQSVFGMFDEDRSGQLSISDLAEALKLLGFAKSKETAKVMAASADLDGDGTISFREFCNMLAKKQEEDADLADGAASDQMFNTEQAKVLRRYLKAKLVGDTLKAPTAQQLQDLMTDPVNGLQFLRQLPVSTMGQLCQGLSLIEVNVGNVLFTQGEPASDVYILLNGEVELRNDPEKASRPHSRVSHSRQGVRPGQSQRLRPIETPEIEPIELDLSPKITKVTEWGQAKAVCSAVLNFLRELGALDIEMQKAVEEWNSVKTAKEARQGFPDPLVESLGFTKTLASLTEDAEGSMGRYYACGLEGVSSDTDSPLSYPILVKAGEPAMKNLERLRGYLRRALKTHKLSQRAHFIVQQFEPLDMAPARTRIICRVVEFCSRATTQLQEWMLLLTPIMRPVSTLVGIDSFMKKDGVAPQAAAKVKGDDNSSFGHVIDHIQAGDMLLVDPLLDEADSYHCSCIATGKRGGRVAFAQFSRRAWLNASVIEPLTFFKTMPLFAGLELMQLQRLAAAAVPRELKCGQKLAERMSEPHSVFLIQKGELQISADLNDSKSLEAALGEQPPELQTPESASRECLVRGFDHCQLRYRRVAQVRPLAVLAAGDVYEPGDLEKKPDPVSRPASPSGVMELPEPSRDPCELIVKSDYAVVYEVQRDLFQKFKEASLKAAGKKSKLALLEHETRSLMRSRTAWRTKRVQQMDKVRVQKAVAFSKLGDPFIAHQHSKGRKPIDTYVAATEGKSQTKSVQLPPTIEKAVACVEKAYTPLRTEPLPPEESIVKMFQNHGHATAYRPKPKDSTRVATPLLDNGRHHRKGLIDAPRKAATPGPTMRAPSRCRTPFEERMHQSDSWKNRKFQSREDAVRQRANSQSATLDFVRPKTVFKGSKPCAPSQVARGARTSSIASRKQVSILQNVGMLGEEGEASLLGYQAGSQSASRLSETRRLPSRDSHPGSVVMLPGAWLGESNVGGFGSKSSVSSRANSRGDFSRGVSRGELSRGISRGEFNRGVSRGESSRGVSRGSFSPGLMSRGGISRGGVSITSITEWGID